MKSKSQTKKHKASPAPAARKVAKRAAGTKNRATQTVKMSEGDDGQLTKA
jgi:hypothetical protein